MISAWLVLAVAGAQTPNHFELVESYLRGERDAALKGLSELPRSRVERDAKAFRNRLAGDPGWSALDPTFRMLRAGTLLHMEKAAEYAATVDREGVQQHLKAAAIILEAADSLEPSVALQLLQRRAYLAVGRIAQSCLEIELGVSLLNEGLQRVRDDPTLLLVRASLQEITVTRGVGAAFARERAPRGQCRRRAASPAWVSRRWNESTGRCSPWRPTRRKHGCASGESWRFSSARRKPSPS